MGKATLRFLICGIVPLLFIGCVSLVENTGRALDGSAFAEKKIAVYHTAKNDPLPMEIKEMRAKTGEHTFLLTLEQLPVMKIRFSSVDSQNEFNLISLEYLGGNTHGWNEFSMELLGTGSFAANSGTALFSLHNDLDWGQISSGRIRRYDTRITGADALTALRNRYERIAALSGWMQTLENSPSRLYAKDFENYWKPILFPEIVSRKKRPEDWQREGDQFVKAEDIRWNTGYTERVFPEELRIIRNSGTMLRDWEEAADWINMQVEWSRIPELLAPEIAINRIK